MFLHVSLMSCVSQKLRIPLAFRHHPRSKVTGSALNEYMTVRILAILAARSVFPSNCKIITEFCAGGIQPSISNVKVNIASVRGFCTGKRFTHESNRTMDMAMSGDNINLDSNKDMTVLGCNESLDEFFFCFSSFIIGFNQTTSQY